MTILLLVLLASLVHILHQTWEAVKESVLFLLKGTQLPLKIFLKILARSI